MAAVTLASPLVCDVATGECLADVCLGRGDVCAEDGPAWIAGSTCVDAVCVCTSTDGGLAPAVPWAAGSDGTGVAICLDDDAAAVGTPCGQSGCSPTITISNPAEMRLACSKPRGVGGGGTADATLCRVLDRLEATAAATLVIVGLLFEGLSAGTFGDSSSLGKGGAVYLRENSGGVLTVSECTFRGNSASYVRHVPTPPAAPRPHACRMPRAGSRVRG
jgi:hypothetical protein